MTKQSSLLSVIQGGPNGFQNSILVVTLLALVTIVRSIYVYIRAHYEFPGPPVKNFWIGNLDQTMADNVHEKVGQALCCLETNVTAYSGCNGIGNMDMSFKPSVSSFNMVVSTRSLTISEVERSFLTRHLYRRPRNDLHHHKLELAEVVGSIRWIPAFERRRFVHTDQSRGVA